MSPIAAQVLVLAKAPVPGKVKTRLTPPFTPQQAAMLAEAALADTLEAAGSASFLRHVLVMADHRNMPGTLRAELPAQFEIVPQRGDTLDQRIAAAFDDTYSRTPVPTVLIGMDTPQVTPGLLETIAQPLAAHQADAVFGYAADGGYWLLGLVKPDARLILGVPMSRPDTGQAQLARLRQAGLRVRQVPELIDVDTVDDALRVAHDAPGSRFTATLAALRPAQYQQAQPAPVAAAQDSAAPAGGRRGSQFAAWHRVMAPAGPR